MAPLKYAVLAGLNIIRKHDYPVEFLYSSAMIAI
jgi:hypothetical protein